LRNYRIQTMDWGRVVGTAVRLRMPDNEPRCSDRVRLGQLVVAAIREVHRIRGERQSSEDKSKRAELWTALQVARRAQREAEYALRAHVENHGCHS
jgi:hypothetical protein